MLWNKLEKHFNSISGSTETPAISKDLDLDFEIRLKKSKENLS
jgi:hypothetical protein